MTSSIRSLYADWTGYNRRTADALAGLSPDDLSLVVRRSEPWPIWAVAGHTVGARVYWLCHVFGEPGAETTPFTDPSGFGWEDDLTTIRSALEVGSAFDTTWRIVAACLDRWAPAMLSEEIPVGTSGKSRMTRQSVLLRLINHEAFHVGEISLTLVSNGREPIDLWPSSDWAANAPRSLREG